MDFVELQPSPIYKLSEKLYNNTFYIMRDDLIPFSFGGNKSRKARFFFEDIAKNGCDCVVTYGSSSSNHCRVIANVAASKGMPCYIISPDEKNIDTFNFQMMKIFGAKIIKCPLKNVKSTIDIKLNELLEEGRIPYFIQGGGHGNLGTKAYLYAYNEIKIFENENMINFDYIFHASGTGTTQAGLICGHLLNEDNIKIIGISYARKNPYAENIVLESVNDYLNSIGKESVELDVVDFIDEYVLDGYGSYNQKILNIIKELLIKDGIPMDTTYTGKAYWGMKQYITKKQIACKNILFIHTGGTPLFFNSLGELVNA